jgi:hypothetical protein
VLSFSYFVVLFSALFGLLCAICFVALSIMVLHALLMLFPRVAIPKNIYVMDWVLVPTDVVDAV